MPLALYTPGSYPGNAPFEASSGAGTGTPANAERYTQTPPQASGNGLASACQVPTVTDVGGGASISGMSNNKPYLFPSPASALRPLLDHAAQTGRHFSEDEATLDVMLALDRDDLKPIRYYVKRWKWTRYKVHSLLPELQDRSHQWRTYFRQDQTDSGQDQTKNAVPDTLRAGFQTDSGQDQTDSGQYSTDTDNRVQNKEENTHARARMKRPTTDEVSDYFKKVGACDEASDFVDYFESVGWIVGKKRAPMKDWKAAVRQWISRDFNGKQAAHQRRQTRREDNGQWV